MPKRPFFITLFTICYILSPPAVLVQASLVNGIPLFGPGNIATRLFFTDIIILGMYLVGAAAIYFVRKWGWYLFIGVSVVLIGYNIIVFFINPRYNLFLLILFNVILAVASGIFFRKHVIAPYFNPRLRWWETEGRYTIRIGCKIRRDGGVLEGEIVDISESGVFTALGENLEVGGVCDMNLGCMDCSLEVKGRIMRKGRAGELDGYGIMFVQTTQAQKEGIARLVNKLEGNGLENGEREAALTSEKKKTASRYRLNHRATVITGDTVVGCRITDLSRYGCFIMGGGGLIEGSVYSIRLECVGLEADVEGIVRRKSGIDGEPGGMGYGLEFQEMSPDTKKTIRIMVKRLTKIGAHERLDEASCVPDEVIDTSVAKTPYRIVLFFKQRVFNADAG